MGISLWYICLVEYIAAGFSAVRLLIWLTLVNCLYRAMETRASGKSPGLIHEARLGGFVEGDIFSLWWNLPWLELKWLWDFCLVCSKLECIRTVWEWLETLICIGIDGIWWIQPRWGMIPKALALWILIGFYSCLKACRTPVGSGLLLAQVATTWMWLCLRHCSGE